LAYLCPKKNYEDMKAKKALIPKSKLWISLTLIFLPILLLFVFREMEYFQEMTDFIKISRIAVCITFIGMFALFLTQWTKDDGDEMYMQLRLRAVLMAVVTTVGVLLTMSLFDLIFDIDSSFHRGFPLMFLILFSQILFFGQQMYKLSNEKEDK